MTTIKSSDVFIERSLHLLETNPSTTRISITYGSQSKKIEKKLKDKVLKKPIDQDKTFVSFKVFDPISGELHKFKTNKVKELSKLLTALGPNGVQITKSVKKDKTSKTTNDQPSTDKDGDIDVESPKEEEQQQQQKSISYAVRGFSSILTNSEIKDDEPIDTQSTNNSAPNSGNSTGTTASKKKNKKKGKR